MGRNFIPYGRLRDGKMGIMVDNMATLNPLVAATELLAALPSETDPDNFDGRVVYSQENKRPYVFVPGNTPKWTPMEGGFPTIGAVNGFPPTVPIPRIGETYYDTSTDTMFLWDGSGNWIKPGVNYAANYVVQRYLGDGSTTTYVLGTAEVVDPDYVEVYVDGVRKYPNPSGDYNMLGAAIVFSTPPATNTNIMIRTLIAESINQNSTIKSVKYTATASQTTFDLPLAGVDANSVFVFEDGVLRYVGGGSNDYTISTQDTRITSLNKITSTVAEVVCIANHNLINGQRIQIRGSNQESYNTDFVIVQIVNPTTFRITVPASIPNSATGNPTMFFSPPGIMDQIVFNTGRTAGHIIAIRVLKSIRLASDLSLDPIPTSNATSPGLYVQGDPSTGIYGDGNGMVGLGSNATALLELNNDGTNASVILKNTDALRLPIGSAAARPATPAQGDFRGNTTAGIPEYFNGTNWITMLSAKGVAFVVFDGTQSLGVLTLLASYNVASVTKTDTGVYTVAFNTAFPDANYAIMGTAQYNTSAGPGMNLVVSPNNAAYTTTSCSIQVMSGQAGVTYDGTRVLLFFLGL